MKRVLAIDVGGTKLATAIVAADGMVSVERRGPTPRTKDPEALLASLVAIAKASLDEDGGSIDCVGVGCGGPMRWPEGIVSPLHIAAWREFPLRARLTAAFGVPCAIDNDAKAFALGEHWLGAGRGARALLGVVVSTGVGAGIVIDGQLVHGASGQAGHVGHVIADPDGPACDCGARGCVEAIASGDALARRGDAAAEAIAERARKGDADAERLYLEAGRALARGIASAATLLDLDRVVIGGGVALGAWDLLEVPLLAELAVRTQLSFTRALSVLRSTLGHRAGLLGAARLAFDAAL
ncbi:MAG TPA: ROK family protein [Candidatus Limnocylindria bacterium]|nr:ROK family protein [Candidatus Limnocylindria bacterium]